MPDYALYNSSLAVFAPTADQRYLLGADLFLNTHFSMSLRRYRPNKRVETVHEEELLAEIIKPSTPIPGNRLWALYGAPGSGKSELIKWLQLKISQDNEGLAQATVRIARHELDPLSIIERFQGILPDEVIADSTYHRWQMARHKPRTMAKLILLFALENLYEEDDVINALFYRLLNVIQPQVEHILRNRNQSQDSEKHEHLELISLETWEIILKETAIQAPLDFEQFRHQLTVTFRDHLLEGLSLPTILNQISTYFICHFGRRPLLLVDDLVQSLNIFATDLLDYFLSLETGHWDVVFGLTPAAFEASERGRRLLQRISQLDTIDDRVEKLWLSDESGRDSYVLTEDNCVVFAEGYLRQLQDIQGSKHSPLYPFNSEALTRLFRGLPPGKGKARYFLRYIKEILTQGKTPLEILDALEERVQTEFIARLEDRRLAQIYEIYGPLQSDTHRSLILPQSTCNLFALEQPLGETAIEPLIQFPNLQHPDLEEIVDEEKIAIRNWLLGKKVNRQLLHGLRKGIARWLRLLVDVERLCDGRNARPNGILRYRQPYLDISPVILLDGVDVETQGLGVTREIGLLAFDFYALGTATKEQASHLLRQLSQTEILVPLIFEAHRQRQNLSHLFVSKVGLEAHELAFLLYLVGACVREEWVWEIPGVTEEFVVELTEIHSRRFVWRDGLTPAKLVAIDKLFADFFQIRENLFDGLLLGKLTNMRSAVDSFQTLASIESGEISSRFRLGRYPLKEIITECQGLVQRWQEVESGTAALSEQTQQILYTLDQKGKVSLTRFVPEIWAEMHAATPQRFAKLYVYQDR